MVSASAHNEALQTCAFAKRPAKGHFVHTSAEQRGNAQSNHNSKATSASTSCRMGKRV
ncbi:unnamed protein product [Ectocarpus sp. CCAP 1310/34]|nr:unnamed protein product [Ectocarpus sp. CCAP 1310/34]